jgi:uncharacterized protein (TIGR02996 family)
MQTIDILTAAVNAAPLDVVARLALADALEEAGESANAAFVRLDVRLEVEKQETGFINPFLFNRWRFTPFGDRPNVPSFVHESDRSRQKQVSFRDMMQKIMEKV